MEKCRFLLFLLILGLLGRNSQAERGDSADGFYPITIHSYPPGAEIYVSDSKYLGRTGRQVRLKNQSYSLTLRMPAHQPVTFTISGLDVKINGRYPPSGAINLDPDSTVQLIRDAVQYRRGSLAIGGIVLLGLTAGVSMYTRKSRKVRRQEEDLRTLTMSLPKFADGEQRSLILQQIGGYRVLSLLGKGGMAEVYTAVPADSLDMKDAVAIKVMNRELRETPLDMERFRRERQMAGELVHPGIVELISSGDHSDGRSYMVMELIDGRELRRLLPELRGDWSRIADLLDQLFSAVDYAHGRGISHRDLKPENVMVTGNDRIKVMDFGLGRAVDSKTITQAGSTMGSPRYIAPEAVSGGNADDRADQYTLGVMAYEMIVGRLPFDSDEVLYLLYSHANVPPPAPSQVADLPPTIDDVLLKMLSKDPRDRYRSVEEARVELLRAVGTLS